ncbi:MAG: DUF885 family protein [Alphaproteobacteria bacterium]|nr:DUF885 family protein [Alphaproteobacteria bacterium]
MAAAAITICAVAGPVAAATHADLVARYDQFRAAIALPVKAGVPDHSPAAMAARAALADAAVADLSAMDSRAWPIPERADHLMVLAEARSVQFQHKVLRQWQRDPSWWATLDIGWGPKIPTAFELPSLPPKDAAARARLAANLAAVPATLAAARSSLTDLKRDLVTLGLAHHAIEARLYDRMARDLAAAKLPKLAQAAAAAASASREFGQWLLAQKADGPSGIGRDAFAWYMRYVLLYPYDFDQMKAIGEREWERNMAFLKMAEHQNRATPMLPMVADLAGFEALRRAADSDLLAFLKTNQIMTVPDWLVVPPPEGPYVMPMNRDPAAPGAFTPAGRNFFREAEDRDPRTLRAHNLPGHIFDMAYRARDPRPIRRDARLNFIDSQRIEGWAFYLEELVVQTGFLDARPKAREIHYILMANRAARLLPELQVHANIWTFDQALTSLAARTPYWMEKTDDTGLYDMALYLRQPGLGINYYFGRIQLEQLLAEMADREGRAFNLTRFHDRFIASGIMPITLVRWEMTGNDDQVQTMWTAPPIP